MEQSINLGSNPEQFTLLKRKLVTFDAFGTYTVCESEKQEDIPVIYKWKKGIL